MTVPTRAAALPVVLRRFPTEGPHVLQGPGENAGVLSVGDGWAVAFKMESHNHPSAVEPYEGAATGAGDGPVTVRVADTTLSLPVGELRRLCAEAIPSRMQLAATAED